MADLTLCIGSRNTSSWSMRAWVALAHTGVRFDEVLIPLGTPDSKERIAAYSSSGKVPVLRHGEVIIWESLAICEYLHELFPDANLWPEDRVVRALGRSVASEIHAEFRDLRAELPQDIRGRHPGRVLSADAREDLERANAIMRTCRQRHGHKGPFLLGDFSIADAMFAPICTRVVTYDLPFDSAGREYVDAVLGCPEVKAWVDGAVEEGRA